MDKIASYETDLACRLSPEEVEQRSHELLNLLGEIEEEVVRQAADKAMLKERMATMLARQAALAGALRRGQETRPVMVEVLADWTTGIARIIRTDTHDEIGRRPLSDAERQLPLAARP